MNIATAYSAWSPHYDSNRNPTRDLDAVVTQRLLGARHFSQIGANPTSGATKTKRRGCLACSRSFLTVCGRA